MEEIFSFKYPGIDIHHMLNCNYNIYIGINEGSKANYGLENNCK